MALAFPETDEEVKTRRQPPYAVVLHNDDFNGFVFVTAVLKKVFGYPREKCFQLMQEAHNKGQAVVWSGLRETAEFKSDQIHSCGPDPANSKAQPLGVTVEPMA